MHQRTLGSRLRAILLATPLIGGSACGSSSGPPNCAGHPQQAHGTVLLPVTGTSGDCHAECQPDGGISLCGSGVVSLDSCAFMALPDGGPGVSCTGLFRCDCTGRRPASLRTAPTPASSHPLGAFFGESARLEAASIPAFHILAGELSALGAPDSLIGDARRSAADEVRHARSTAALARRYGGEAIRPRFAAQPEGRSLEAIATENAIEGCVRETYGALVAMWQARHASDPVIAAAMGPIAQDETRHAELAWRVAAWAEPRLSPSAGARVAKARALALADLGVSGCSPVAASLVALAGLPSPAVAALLVGGLARDLQHHEIAARSGIRGS